MRQTGKPYFNDVQAFFMLPDCLAMQGALVYIADIDFRQF